MERQLGVQLQQQLGWDDEMTAAIVATVKSAAERNASSELEDLIQVRQASVHISMLHGCTLTEVLPV